MAKGDKDYENQVIVGELTDIINQLKADHRGRDALYDKIDSVVYQKNKVSIPDAYAKTTIAVHNPLPARTVNTITAALSVNPPTINFSPVGFGPSGEENATEREHFFEASWARQEKESGQALFRKVVYSVVSKGEGILKTVQRDKSAWAAYTRYALGLKGELDAKTLAKQMSQDEADQEYNQKTEEMKRKQPYPIVTSFVHARTFYAIRGERGFTFICELKEVAYSDTLAYYGYGLTSDAKVVSAAMGLPRVQWAGAMGSQKTITMAECWDAATGYATYILIGPGQTSSQSGNVGKGKIVKRFKHGYTDRTTQALRGPYFHAYGLVTDSAAPDQAGLGMLFGYLDLYPLLDSYLTMQSNAAYQTGYAAFKKVAQNGAGLPPPPFGDDGAAKAPGGVTTRITPGEVLPFDVAPIEQPHYGVDLDKAIGQTERMLQPALPDILQGIIGDNSGYAANQGQYLAALYHSPLVSNIETMMGNRAGWESWLIENFIGEPVYVWDERRRGQQSKAAWTSIGPKDLNGAHTYSVKLDPKTPSNEVILARLVTELLQARLIAPEDAVTRMGGNPDEVELAWDLYDLKQRPEIRDKLMEKTLDKLSLSDKQTYGGQPQAAGGMAPAGGLQPTEGQVFTPGQNGMPIAPTPQGSVTGSGPGGTVSGAPGGIPGQPANAMPLPGQTGG